jgi:hypothetical protein
MRNIRARDLGLVQTYLRSKNLDLPDLWLIGQAHYSNSGFAFIAVFGIEDDTTRRRSIRSHAADLLMQLGYQVELKSGCDIFEIYPDRPGSRHEELSMLATMQKLIEPNF